MTKKLTAAVAAAAVALSMSPVASAQLSSGSSLSSFGGVSSPVDDRPGYIRDLEDLGAEMMNRQGHVRHAEYDRAADDAIQDAVNGQVTWVRGYLPGFQSYYTATYMDLGYYYSYERTLVSDADALEELFTNSQAEPVATGPYGVAYDTDGTYIYSVVVRPRSI